MRKVETLVKFVFENWIFKNNPDEPFTWDSGIMSPVDANFSQIMNYPYIRALILEMLSIKITEKIEGGLAFDAVIGTSTAGIWIGKLIAEKFYKPFVILKDGKAFEEPQYAGIKIPYPHDCDLIISGTPFGISQAISLANQKGVPMGYIRREPKNHGEKVKIEGNPTGQNAFVIDFFRNASQEGQIKTILHENNIAIAGMWTECISPKAYDLNGKNILIIDDLISTGGSLLKEAEVAIGLGARVLCAASIFTYCFEESTRNASKLGIDHMVSALNIHDIMKVGINNNFIKKEDELLLKNFFVNPYNWYEIYHPDKQLNGC